MQSTAIPIWITELKNEIERVGYGEILLIVRKGKPTKFKTTVYKSVTGEPTDNLPGDSFIKEKQS